MLGGGGLDADGVEVNAEDGGDNLSHGDDIGREFGALQGYGDVDVADLPAALVNHFHDFPEQNLAVDALPLVRRVGEEMADVPEGEGPEEGVAEGVERHVAVGMGDAADRAVFNADAPEPEGKAHREGVDVVAVACSDIFHKSVISSEVEKSLQR